MLNIPYFNENIDNNNEKNLINNLIENIDENIKTIDQNIND